MVLGRLTATLWLSSLLCACSTVQRPVEIILTRCRENIDWVEDFGYGNITTVYDKCGLTSGPGHHVECANLGRESGTYLQHIVDHYEDLADWTVFSQAGEPTYGYRGHRLGGGHMMRNVHFKDYVEARKTRQTNPLFFVFTVVMLAAENHIFQCIRHGYGESYTKPTSETVQQKMCGSVADWHHWHEFPEWFTSMVQRLQVEQKAPIAHFDIAATLDILGAHPAQGTAFFAQGARFAASREAIQARPKAYYEGLLQHLNHQDPWAGYFMEWLWFYILGGSSTPCGFEEEVASSHLAWMSSGKGRQDAMEVQGTSGTSGVSGGGNATINSSIISGSIQDMVSGSTTSVVFTAATTTFTILQTITTLSLTSSGALIFSQGLTFTNANGYIQCGSLSLGASSTITAASVTVTTVAVAMTVTINAFLSVTSGSIDLAAGSSLTLSSSAQVASSQITGSGQLQVSGLGQRVLLKFVMIASSISVTLVTSTQSRRINFSTTVPLQQCATTNTGTLTLGTGTVAIFDLSCTTNQSGYVYSNYIASLNANGGTLYFTGVTSSSALSAIGTWSNVAATPIEISNMTTLASFCVNILVYSTSSSCTLLWNSVTYDSCPSGYVCTLVGEPYTGKLPLTYPNLCAVKYCQASDRNLALLGLIALVAILPIAGLCGFGVWCCMKKRRDG